MPTTPSQMVTMMRDLGITDAHLREGDQAGERPAGTLPDGCVAIVYGPGHPGTEGGPHIPMAEPVAVVIYVPEPGGSIGKPQDSYRRPDARASAPRTGRLPVTSQAVTATGKYSSEILLGMRELLRDGYAVTWEVGALPGGRRAMPCSASISSMTRREVPNLAATWARDSFWSR